MPNRHDRSDKQPEPKSLEPEGLPAKPYEVLELDPSASDAEIKKAYFQKVREHPPEKDPQQFKRIRAAYDALRTPEARAATDLFMLHPPPEYETYKRAPTLTVDYVESDWDAVLRADTDLDRTDFSKDFRNIKL
jgi:curved DNA-binding protein CbpA